MIANTAISMYERVNYLVYYYTDSFTRPTETYSFTMQYELTVRQLCILSSMYMTHDRVVYVYVYLATIDLLYASHFTNKLY